MKIAYRYSVPMYVVELSEDEVRTLRYILKHTPPRCLGSVGPQLLREFNQLLNGDTHASDQS